MELKDFVAETLSSIAEGIAEAQKRTKGLHECRISPRHVAANAEAAKKDVSYQIEYQGDSLEKVSFDIAVTTAISGEASGKGKIIVANASVSTEAEYSKCSRIKFDVFVAWPRLSQP